MKRILVCANPDLNLIDGSSIWSQTITLALAETGLARVDFLAKSKPVRSDLFKPLHRHRYINIIDGTDSQYWSGHTYIALQNQQISDVAVKLHKSRPYDIIVVRGYEIATALSNYPDMLARSWIYLTDIPQTKTLCSEEYNQNLSIFAVAAARILCQSKGFLELWREIVPTAPMDKFCLYSPVIPNIPDELPTVEERPLRAVYSGKFKDDWKTLEMAVNWPQIRRVMPDAELIMIGDKIHNEPDQPDYAEQMRKALEHTEGVTWLGAMPRSRVQKELEKARVGLSWRSEAMNETLEYSTKMLEYGGAGCAVILNRTPLHEEILGSDYPLFANSEQEFVQQVRQALTQPHLVQDAVSRLMSLAKKHTFSTRTKLLKQWIQENSSAQKTTILVAGHDLKFFNLLQKKLEETDKYIFLIDNWEGHCNHDSQQSKRLLEYADIIICEWCMGNVQWYSKHKKPHQRLVARFHLQEIDLPYMSEANHNNIDHIVFVSDSIRRAGTAFFGLSQTKTSVVANLMDEKRFLPGKKTGDAPYTLGMIGITPKRKRLDRALDTLEFLLQDGSRYQLRIKGAHPFDYSWLVGRRDELEYYQQIMERINESELLRYKVIFDPPGNDVNQWLSLVGFILSPSDFESFHLAIGEGMLTGCVPVVWNWDGAAEIWPEGAVVDSARQAADKIRSVSGEQWQEQGKAARKFVMCRYGLDDIVTQWEQILSKGVAGC